MTETMIDVTVTVSHLFERLGVPYLLGGSMASMLHGEPRATRDVDFAAAMRFEHVVPFAAGTRGPFHVDETDIRDAISLQRMFNVIHIRSGTKVDVHVRKLTGFHASEFERARDMRLTRDPESSVRVASAEDIVLQKLAWYRQGDHVSDRQWRDVQGVLKARREELDLPYLKRWAEELGVEDLLDRSLHESGFSNRKPQ